MVDGRVRPVHFPFSAIYGMEDAKKALLCLIVNPRIKGMLIKGASGVAKTTLARSISGELSGRTIINVPLNVTDEQLFGCLDIEAAIKDGMISMQEGLLERANNNFLYLDDVNLFDQRVISEVMDCVLTRKVTVERENVSSMYTCNTTVIATMNSADSYLNPRVLDCFDMCIQVPAPNGVKDREEIIRRNIEYSEDPDSFVKKYSLEEEKVVKNLLDARKLLKDVTISEDMIAVVSELCVKTDIEGYRGDISTVIVSMTLAALNGRTEVILEDVRQSALFCLYHRQNMKLKEKSEKQKNKEALEGQQDYEIMGSGQTHMNRCIHDDCKEDPEELSQEAIDGVTEPDPDSVMTGYIYEVDDVITKIGETFKAIDVFESESRKARGAANDGGKRLFMKSNDRSGKYIGSRITESKNPDLAFDATVRAAAPYQRRRHNENHDDGDTIIIENHDLREKVREKRSSSTFLFLLDTSGSLIIRNRMVAVKATILSMLKNNYVKRDRIGFMTFNEESINMLMPPTKSVDTIYKLLDNLPIGKRTPLSGAMLAVSNYMTTYVRKRPDEKCYVILITDGEANVSIDENADPIEESLRVAAKISIPNTEWVVIDSGKRFVESDDALNLAHALRARYYRLEDLKASEESINLEESKSVI